MVSSSQTMTSLVLIFSFNFFFLTIPISCNLVTDICNETANSGFCFNTFYNNGSSTDVPGLDRFAIDTATTDIKGAKADIQPALAKTNDPKQKAVYALCLNNYDDALSALAAARDKLSTRDFPGVKTAADVFARDAVSCRKAFDTAPDRPDIIAEDIHFVELHSGIIVATSKRL